ncbi:hypothetical protein BKK49_09750 [Rodentibacter rarus]|uniref:Uncharacterized protein n=1 Tax=Rodentibacter rarus TaxID=1908260 RepID=A0A1V3IM50_9PAST|nr:hypothetical protein BKK49_09750 [Rodentibacter rarus]OOF42529.1 hypothetical protein BKK50_06700 [Rodentibacter rarus]
MDRSRRKSRFDVNATRARQAQTQTNCFIGRGCSAPKREWKHLLYSKPLPTPAGQGKVFKVVINAIMRKLLTILNVIVRDGSQWNAYVV